MEVPHVKSGKRIPFAPAPGAEDNPHQQKRVVAGLQGWTLPQTHQAGTAYNRMESVGYFGLHAAAFPKPRSGRKQRSEAIK